jgi:hypothetical protein
MSDVFIWIYSGGGGATFMKYFKGGVSYKSLRTSDLGTNKVIHLSLPPIVNNVTIYNIFQIASNMERQALSVFDRMTICARSHEP